VTKNVTYRCYKVTIYVTLVTIYVTFLYIVTLSVTLSIINDLHSIGSQNFIHIAPTL